jgi:hypothetical protein
LCYSEALVNAVSRTRFSNGALHGDTQRTKYTQNRTLRDTIVHLLSGVKPKLISFVALANRNARKWDRYPGTDIETTANPNG